MKHILYFAGYRMVLLRWHANAFMGTAEFEPDAKGFAAFARLLREEVKKPVKLLVDIIEEDFRLEHAPHLIGRDRTAFHRRLANKYFRSYQHVHVETQERQTTGRRDDVVLLSALTNPGLFGPWIEVLYKYKIPLQGIYSLPLVGEGLLKTLRAQNKSALVISQQVPSSIRQSFYHRGKLKLSRLAPGGDDTISNIDALNEEIERTVRYLENQHYVDLEKKLDIYIIAPGTEHPVLSRELRNDSQKEFHIIDKDRLAADLGIKSMLPGKYSHSLFTHLLLAGKYRKRHYGTLKNKFYFYHYLARRGMFAMAACLFSVSLLWSMSLAIDGFVLSLHRRSLTEENRKYESLYKEAVSDIGEVDLDVSDIRDAVTVAEKLEKYYQATPIEYMKRISKSLEQNPGVEIKTIEWLQTGDSNHTFGEVQKASDRRSNLRMQNRKPLRYEKALVEANITDYNDNPRIAVESVNRFIKDLRRNLPDGTVEVIKMPFDVDPSSRIVSHGAGAPGRQSNDKATFTFVLMREREIQ
jgi:hypothetical protein